MNKDGLIRKSYFLSRLTLYFLVVFAYIGVWSAAPKYLSVIDDLFTTIVSLTLIYYFNPLMNTKFTNFHRQVAFSAGIVIFIQTSLVTFLKSLIKKI